jgi:hypothetical protein
MATLRAERYARIAAISTRAPRRAHTDAAALRCAGTPEQATPPRYGGTPADANPAAGMGSPEELDMGFMQITEFVRGELRTAANTGRCSREP